MAMTKFFPPSLYRKITHYDVTLTLYVTMYAKHKGDITQ